MTTAGKSAVAGWHRVVAVLLATLFIIEPAISADDGIIDYQHWNPLYDNLNDNLQNRLNATVEQQSIWSRLIKQKKMAIGLVDLNGPNPRFASINGDTMMYAASLPKIAILLAAVYSFEEGTLQEDDEVLDDLSSMIAVSSNDAATRMIERIGMDRINIILQKPEFLFYDPAAGGGLWVGKPYAKNTVRKGDPLFNISHGATVNQVSRFYYRLATGKVINRERSLQMLEFLEDPAIEHKFVYVLHERAPGARLFRKSGTWRRWHADSVLVRGTQWRNYILVALVESRDGETILRKLVPVVENILSPR